VLENTEDGPPETFKINLSVSGKLMKKEDEIDIKISSKTWERLFVYAGGFKVIIPFVCILAAFAQLKTYSDYVV